jgi:hypothetical protein
MRKSWDLNMANTIKFTAGSKEAELIKSYPIPSIKTIPKWYKDVPPFADGEKKLHFPMGHGMPNLTLKKCVPFLDALTSGYMYTLEEDIHVEIDKVGKPLIRWRSGDNVLTWHSPDQFPGVPIPNSYHYMVAKWRNDWVINTPKGYSVLFTHPSNRFDLPFTTLSGLVDSTSYEIPVQFPFIHKKDFEGIIEAGTPVCQLHPMKIEDWNSHMVGFDSEQNYIAKKKFFRDFVSSYKKNNWSKKSYN